MRHTPRISVPQPREAKEGFDHMGKAFAGRYFHAHVGVSFARIPPVMPYIRLDSSRLSLANNARLSVTFHGQFTLKNSEAFNYLGMAVLPDHPCTYTRDKLCDNTMLVVVMSEFEDCRVLPGNGVFPDLADLNWGAVWRFLRIRMGHWNYLCSLVDQISRLRIQRGAS